MDICSQGEGEDLKGTKRLHHVSEETACKGCLRLQPVSSCVGDAGPMHEQKICQKTNFHPVITEINNDEELFPAAIQSTAMGSYHVNKGEINCSPEQS